jgi:2,4-dienoyl-CoA reductase-like NADH-dependent reductase (Old Yellow Enzyme family)
VVDPFTPFRLGPITLRNRLVKAATNEGLSRHGLVTDELIAFHRRFAAGGVGATTLAYCSVSPEGRTFRHQMLMGPEAGPGLAQLVDAVHIQGAAAVIQLGHAGWFANPKASGSPSIGPSRKFSPYGLTFSRAMDGADMGRVRDDFARAARLAAEAGFDAVEVHVGHGYLLSQFLSPWTNRRDDEHGGSLEDRARFPREVLGAVRAALDDVDAPVALWAKLNMSDGFRGGLSLSEGVAVARMLEADGSVDALQLTGGFTARTPMFLMRGDVPLREMMANERDPIRRWGLRIVGRRLMEGWPFEEGFFLDDARQVRDQVTLPLCALGGIRHRATVDEALADGFEMVGMARALLRDPDLPLRYEAGEADESLCISCNQCVVEMERPAGTRCVFVPDDWAADTDL